MFGILLQGAMAIVLFLAAVHLRLSIRRQRSREWAQILAGIVQSGGRLSQLSYGSIFSSGLDCRIDEVWERIDGTRGLWAIFRNAGVFLEAINYMESFCDPDPRFRRAMDELRQEIRRLRSAVLMVLLRCLLVSRRGTVFLTVGETARTYTALVAQLSLAINDNCPELLIPYRFFIMQS